MHAGRKELLFYLIPAAAMTVYLSVIFVQPREPISLIFLTVFALCAAAGGCLFFCFSDDYWRMRERKGQQWMAEHPRLMVFVNGLYLLGLVNFLWQIWKLVTKWKGW